MNEEPRLQGPFLVISWAVRAFGGHLLLIFNRAEREVIPKSMQLVAGRTGQEYNRRKKRKGAFWEDRYHVRMGSATDGVRMGHGYGYTDDGWGRATLSD